MICAIVLAAGRSRRMGRQKLLLPFAESTVLARMTNAFLKAPVDRLLVVVPPNANDLRAALADQPVQFVENPDPAGEMLSSVRCGVRALPAAAKIVAVSPGDQPALQPSLVRELLAAFKTIGSGILVPVYHGRRGHPLLFSAGYAAEILTSSEGIGLRGLLKAHPDDVSEFTVANAAVLQDLDTPADYQSARE